MSKTQIFSIYDDLSGAYMEPFFIITLGMAVGVVADLMATDPEHELTKGRKNYHLYHLGEWNYDRGLLEPFEAPKLIMPLEEIYVKTNKSEKKS